MLVQTIGNSLNNLAITPWCIQYDDQFRTLLNNIWLLALGVSVNPFNGIANGFIHAEE